MRLENQRSNTDIQQKDGSDKKMKPLNVDRERMKQAMRAEELQLKNDQVQALWQAKEHAAKQEVARERGQRNAPTCEISLGHQPDRYPGRGGTLEDARAFLESLPEHAKEAYREYRRYAKNYGFKEAKKKYQEEYQISQQYELIRRKSKNPNINLEGQRNAVVPCDSSSNLSQSSGRSKNDEGTQSRLEASSSSHGPDAQTTSSPILHLLFPTAPDGLRKKKE